MPLVHSPVGITSSQLTLCLRVWLWFQVCVLGTPGWVRWFCFSLLLRLLYLPSAMRSCQATSPEWLLAIHCPSLHMFACDSHNDKILSEKVVRSPFQFATTTISFGMSFFVIVLVATSFDGNVWQGKCPT